MHYALHSSSTALMIFLYLYYDAGYATNCNHRCQWPPWHLRLIDFVGALLTACSGDLLLQLTSYAHWKRSYCMQCYLCKSTDANGKILRPLTCIHLFPPAHLPRLPSGLAQRLQVTRPTNSGEETTIYAFNILTWLASSVAWDEPGRCTAL